MELSKWEIREILQRAYGLPVAKVNTVNFDGNVKRWQGRYLYRTKKWKKAIVQLEPRFEGDTFGWPQSKDDIVKKIDAEAESIAVE